MYVEDIGSPKLADRMHIPVERAASSRDTGCSLIRYFGLVLYLL